MSRPDRSRRVFLAGAGAGLAWPAAAGAQTAPRPAPAAPTAWFNVRDFGAAGDGRRDDTAALQAALDAAAAAGGTVLVPHGVYLTRTLTIKTRVHLLGAGIEASVLKLRDGTNDDLLRTHDHARLVGTNATEGPYNWSVRNLTLDGNRARNDAGCGLRVYGWGYVLSDLRVRQCAGAGIDSEWSTEDPPETPGGMNTPGDSMEAQVVNFKVHNCGGGGVIWRGPHDSQFVNGVVYGVKTYGFQIASGPKFSSTGCQLVNCHVWGNHIYCYKIDAGYVTLVNCVGEWANVAQVHVNDGDATLSACRFFGSAPRKQVGIEIGSPDHPVYGTQVDARMADLTGGAFKFTNEGGSGQLRALVYQTAGVAYTGKPARGTRLELQVNGLPEGSATWFPLGPLGWNGGTPIVRHLSGTEDWTPPPLAAGRAAWTVVKVKGASLGDTVAVGFTQPLPAGVLISGAVTADDAVTVTLFNGSGRPVTVKPGTARADCWVH